MGGGPDQDDEEQESFFVHPKNDNNFVDQDNNHPNGIFHDGADDKDRNGVISQNQSRTHNKSKNEMMKLLFMNGKEQTTVSHKNTIKDTILKKIS